MQDNALLQLPKTNLHIHSRFSDGANSIDMIVDRAIELQFNYIAFTDHFSNSWKARAIKTLDNYKKISIYLKTIDNQNQRLGEENVQLKVLKGIEIDLGSEFEYITKLVNPSQFDLILLEYLNSVDTLEFTRDLLDFWESKLEEKGKNPPIIGLAHFDPSYFIYNELDTLIDFLMGYNLYYEFNSAYSDYYAAKYRDLFTKIGEYKIPVGVGADSHHLDELNLINDALERISYYELTDNYKKFIEPLQKL